MYMCGRVRVPWILVWRSNHWAFRLTIRGVFIRVSGRCEGGGHIPFTWACFRACVCWNSGLQVCVYDFTLLYIYIWCYHSQIMASVPTHSSHGGISGSVWLFTPLYRPAWYNSNNNVPERRIFHHVLVKYHSKINDNMYILIILLSLWTVFITSHLGRHRYSSHATSDSSPTTTVIVTPPRSFQLSILVKQCREYNNYGHISSQICSSAYKKYAYVLPESVDHELSLIGVYIVFSMIFINLTHNNRIWSIMTCSHIHFHQQSIYMLHQYEKQIPTMMFKVSNMHTSWN